MLILGETIRLTRKESDLLMMLSGADPSRIRTLGQLVNFVEGRLMLYNGSSPEERMLRRLLADFLQKQSVTV